MALGNFAAQVDAWVRKSDARMLAVYRESVKRTVSIAQSRIPVDLGFARASVRASTQSMPPIDRSLDNKAKVAVAYDPGPIVLAIAQANLSSPLYIGWTASYVAALERGHSKQAPSGFIRLAAMQWSETVAGVVADAKARVTSGMK